MMEMMTSLPICPKCGTEQPEVFQVTRRKGQHVGLYCYLCDTYIKWVKQNDSFTIPTDASVETIRNILYCNLPKGTLDELFKRYSHITR